MFRKLLIATVIIIGLAILAFWSPWQQWDFSITSILGIESKDEFSALKVKSLGGTLEVFVDGQSFGETSADEDFLEVFPVEPGEHTVRLVRKADADYTEIVRKINFEPAVDVIIGYEIGPNEQFSEGHILYARRSFTAQGDPGVEVYSSPEKVNVQLDGQDIGQTPLKDIALTTDRKHTLAFSKPGYDPLEIEILPENQADRDKLKNMILTLEINLFAQPVRIVEQ
ncbi:MAG: PEGA domain protein [candidate division WS6 bacterium OLB20]|uniref:PEGA domain protein n=1 Tax=candidate division WS6 bacterium OLB20 TaxID=1617426 RepID=A0A136LX33_9BACT|nr:MAG: PEGA domain protein [candidate division WS6 bacterium OLB20]